MSETPIKTAVRDTPLAAVSRAGAIRRVAMIAPSGAHLARLRGGLIGAIQRQRHAVMCFAHDYASGSDAALDALGAERRSLPPRPPGVQLFAERRSVIRLAEDLAAFRPHVVVVSGAETAWQGAKAARKAKAGQIVVIVNEVPAKGMNEANLRTAARALELADLGVFHNGEDAKTLKARGMLPADLAYVVVPGAGVDLTFHEGQPLPPLAAGLVFLMIARLETGKGVLDYCEAARVLSARAPSARFQLAGPAGSLTKAALEAYGTCVEYLGPLDDVRPALGACHVYVYPSLTEGMPRSVLEAMAAGRPVITTNTAGCRDTVDERINGCLVPPSDPMALAAAMESFLKRPDLIPSLARASRAKAERRFDQRDVHATLMGLMGLA